MGVFHFKRFDVDDHGCGMKICSDSVLLAAWFLPACGDAAGVADIGAGSGILSLLAADILPQARITAVEIDPAAAEAAAKNFEASPWSDRLSVVNDDFKTLCDSGLKFDAVISNPPYFTTGMRSADGSRAGARHQRGLSYASLLNSHLVADGGRLGMVSPAEFEHEIIYQAELGGLKLRRLCRVATSPSKGVTRLLWEFSTHDGPVDDIVLTMRGAGGGYTDAYRALVEPYYTKI